MSKLVLIDGNAILHRAYHALPKTLTSKKGEPINAVYGFVSMLLRIITDLKPTHLAVCFDRKEPTFRKKEFADYQAHRPETDQDLSSQFEIAKRVVEAFGIPVYEKEGFEADDVIGTLATQAVRNQRLEVGKKVKKTKLQPLSSSELDEVIIVTGDRDLLQLVTDKVKVYLPVKGLSKAILMGEKEVIKKMGVKPSQIDEYKALVGDPSDNYKGVPGIGPKTAEKLLSQYQDLDDLYQNIEKIDSRIAEKLKKGEESARISQHLAQIVKDVPVEFDLKKAGGWQIENDEVFKLFAEIGFRTLTKRVLEFGEEKGEIVHYQKNLKSKQIQETARRIAEILEEERYAIRGTASLFLQGMEMKVDDIDVICDEKTALLCNKVFEKYLVSQVNYQESEKFKSFFGEFNFDGVKVEVMGEWQIKNEKGDWGKIYNADKDQTTEVEVNGKKITVTTIETELSMFTQMGRWHAYQKIKKQVEKLNQRTLF